MKSIQDYAPSHRYFKRLQSLPFESLTEDQKSKLKEYEQINQKPKEFTEQQIAFRNQYIEKMKSSNTTQILMEIKKEDLQYLFFEEFKKFNGKDFIKTNDSFENLDIVLNYFTRDEKFYSSKRLSNLSKPNLDKGLLIVGDFGCGKSSMMEIFSRVLCHNRFYNSFVFKPMNDIVSDFEALKDHHEKNDFWHRMNIVRYLFDDVKTEREASNYGKSNLFKEIAEKRNYNGIITHVTCNYDPSKPNDLQQSIREFGTKYGGRVYDRIFEMFNIVEFKGKSFRV